MLLCLFLLVFLRQDTLSLATTPGPQTIKTGQIIFTGRRFEAKSIKTGRIVFTGRRFEAKTIKAGQIIFTGRRFEAKTIKTGQIIFTGQRYGDFFDISKAEVSLKTRQQKTVDVPKAGKRNIGGGMKTLSGESSLGPRGMAGGGKRISFASKIAKQEPVKKGNEPKIMVASIAAKPAPLTEGKPVTLIVSLRNKGRAGSKGASFKVKCTPPPGVEDCLVPDGPHSMVGAIQPGMMKSMKLHGAKPAAAGVYRVEVTPLPMNKNQRPVTATFTVLHKIIPRKAPLLKTMPGAGGSAHVDRGGLTIPKTIRPIPPARKTAPTLRSGKANATPPQQAEKVITPAIQPREESRPQKDFLPQLKLHVQ